MKIDFVALLFVFASIFPSTVLADYLLTGLQIVDCVNIENKHDKFWGMRTKYKAYPTFSQKDQTGFYTMNGRLGWHSTWLVLIDLTTEPPLAFETYGINGDNRGGFARRAVPKTIKLSLEACGVSWKGLWPNGFPIVR